jgi:hypothetical protein
MGRTHKYHRVTYENENRFTALARSLKIYNMGAYKSFIFDYLPLMRNGELPGEKQEDGTYKIHLQADPVFEFVHGETCIVYKRKGNLITLLRLEPEEFLEMGRRMFLTTYRGTPVTSAKDRFKIDFYYVKNKK